MKILLVHNRYQQCGGEDAVFSREYSLLTRNGNVVETVVVDSPSHYDFHDKVRICLQSNWSQNGYRLVLNSILNHLPDIVHVHNFFPLLTPSIYDACITTNTAVIQTLHNFRTICPGALLMKEGKICEKCIKGSPYHAIVHRCYRNSIPGSWAVSRMVSYHRKNLTWHQKIDRFIALTHFGKSKFVEAGFPANKIFVKPNFYQKSIVDAENRTKERKGALFVGRLSLEKGVGTMIDAFQTLEISLRIVGEGPLLDEYTQVIHSPHIKFLNKLTNEQVENEMSHASFLIMPSEWYETFGLVIIEAFAHGLPVITSRLGAMAELVEDGVTGLHFEPGNSQDLANKVVWIHNHPAERHLMGENALRIYKEKYTPDINYAILMEIYRQALISKN